MSEITIQWISFAQLICSCIYATLYGFGGVMLRQQLRRIGGSLFFVASIITFSLIKGNFSFWYLLSLPLIYGAVSIGYGADTTPIKIFKRAYCGLAYACASIPIFAVSGNWDLLALHTVFCLLTSIILGARNPFDNARAEETSIGFVIAFLPLMSI